MRADWKTLLTQKGAVIDHDCVLHFGDLAHELQAALAGDVLCDLSHQGLIAASGPDTAPFLQGQLTNDVRQVTPERSQLSAYCSPKGRLLAIFRLFRRDETYYLRLPRELLEPTLKRLRMFVLRAKTTLEDASDKLLRFGLSGPQAEALLQGVLPRIPVRADEMTQSGAITVLRLPGLHPRFEIHGESDAVKDLWTTLAPQATLAGAEPWRLLDIMTGLPVIYPETIDAFVPQMVNLQLVDGVSFTKGCYTGQEIVARTQYLGKLKRRLYRAHIDHATCPRPGDELFSPQTEAGQSAGKIVDAARHPQGGCQVLAVVLIDGAEGGTVSLGDARGARFRFEPLPYFD